MNIVSLLFSAVAMLFSMKCSLGWRRFGLSCNCFNNRLF